MAAHHNAVAPGHLHYAGNTARKWTIESSGDNFKLVIYSSCLVKKRISLYSSVAIRLAAAELKVVSLMERIPGERSYLPRLRDRYGVLCLCARFDRARASRSKRIARSLVAGSPISLVDRLRAIHLPRTRFRARARARACTQPRGCIHRRILLSCRSRGQPFHFFHVSRIPLPYRKRSRSP